jgi:hypothetical protein
MWLNAVRHPEDIGVGYLRRTVNFDTPFAGEPGGVTTNGVPIGGLEAGAMVLGVDVVVETAFNAGTTNTLNVGTPADDNGFADTVGVAPGTVGFKPNLQGALSGIPLAANTVVYAKFAQTGTAATTGKATIVVKFANKREGEGTIFPGN